eukprot:1138019-Pelagomonas_calceolata.AAC.1
MGVVLHLVVDEGSPSVLFINRAVSPTICMGYVKIMTSKAWHSELRGLMTGVSRLCGVFGQEGGLQILPFWPVSVLHGELGCVEMWLTVLWLAFALQ